MSCAWSIQPERFSSLRTILSRRPVRTRTGERQSTQPPVQPLPPSKPPVQSLPPSEPPVQQRPSVQPQPLQPPIQKLLSSQPSIEPWKPIYPDYAVGIQEQKKEVTKLLDMERESQLSLAVVIYGVGGIGKTTLATAVIADLDLTQYNYSGVEIHADRSRNDIRSFQRQILKDAFPAYTYGRNLMFTNSAEGRDHLTSAFQAQGNKPVFLFIDNALREEDLQELFPERLAGLPKRSRIVLTTRNLGVTDMLEYAGLERRDYPVGTLPDQDALKILFKEDNIRGRENMQKVLKISDGIPLVLEIVGARLRKQNYMVERCTQIFEALESREDVKEENLCQRIVTSVYNELVPSTQEAFLDICCFFANWNRSDLEYIVGAEDVTLLLEAALMKTSSKDELIVQNIIRAKG
ncbi:TMV resistance protein N-like [Cryptomeria japonica]|uniref:TMV resistance protein N-like n=1 Tax=Cryptomeria japonica TaxID=3369 RepID=UPI0027DA28D6|nr:TMV resistance protein N-like [Cryptomeria japonica]